MLAPPGGDAAHLVEAVEDLPIQQFVPQAGVEAFDVTVFSRTSGLDIRGHHPRSPQSASHGIGNEFRAVAHQEA